MSSFELHTPQGRYQQILEPVPSFGISSLHTDEGHTGKGHIGEDHTGEGHTDEDDTTYHGHNPDPEPEPGAASEHTLARNQSIWPGFVWLFLTTLIGALIIVVVRIYQLKGNISKAEKHAFNTLSTGLILVLGLNFFEAFKALAKAAGPWISRWRPWKRSEIHLVDHLDNLTAVLNLAWKARTRFWTVWFCIVWIALNILAQVAVAVISLTWEVNDGTSFNDTYLRPGNVTASKLKCYDDLYNNNPCSKNAPNDKTNQALAHAYGDLALYSKPCNYTTNEDVIKTPHDCSYFCRREPRNQEFQYRFNEFNPSDFNRNVSRKAYPHFTNRSISAFGTCYNYSAGDKHDLGNGTSVFEYKNASGSVLGNISLPDESTGISSTTYIYRGLNSPQIAPAERCGNRCTVVWAYRSNGSVDDGTAQEPSQFYECNVTVTPVTNTNRTVQELPDDMARLAAASISLSGRKSGPGPGQWNQFQFYPYGSAWEAHHRDPDQVAADMAESAIGSISTMARTNQPVYYASQVPHLGSNLAVHWPYLIALAAGIIVTHVLLYLGALSLTKMN